MPAPPNPADEPERLAAVQATGLLDSPPTELFDGLVRVATQLFDTPMAAISLVDRERQWLKAAHGLSSKSVHRDLSFCAHAILNPNEVLCVPDATQDPRFADNALVLAEPHIRFYAGAPIIDASGAPLGTLCIIDREPRQPDDEILARLQDMAASVSAAIQLHALHARQQEAAALDTLTSLPGRPALDDLLAELLGGNHTPNCTLLLLDIDNLRGLNDLFGHGGGDRAIAEVGRRLADPAFAALAYRLEGDKFALLAAAAYEIDRNALCARIQHHLAAPFQIDGLDVPLRISIGAASPRITPRGAAPLPTDGPTLFRQADAALRLAKHRGGGHACDAASLGADAARLGRLHLGQQLRAALVPSGKEPFTLEFQPIINLGSSSVASMEALIRWSPPGFEPVSPGEFVVLAERIGLVSHLDRWVLATACRAASGWTTPWGISVNVSAISFGLIDVAALVADALASTALPPARLTIEMTETALTREPERTRNAVIALRSMGVGVALDDFGAGNGSLTTLRSFPFSELKIDRGLIGGIAENSAQAHMVELVTRLGLSLGVKVVAEGVETSQELAIVTTFGVTHVQGRLLSWPVPACQLPAAAHAAAHAALVPLTFQSAFCV